MHLQQRLKRKRKGLWEVKLLIQRNSGFYGNRSRIVWLVQLPLPLPSVGAQLSLALYLCGQLFSVSFILPAPGGLLQQHPLPQKQKGKKDSRHLG